MTEEERIKTLQDEFEITKEELKKLLYDIRTYMMEAQTPIPNDLERERLTTLINEIDEDKRQSLRIQTESEKKDTSPATGNSEKGVEPHGDR